MDKALETTGPCKAAPGYLLTALRGGKIGNGRKLLERLLCDPRMQTAWTQLQRKVRSDEQWRTVWSAIAHAKLLADKSKRSRLRRSDLRDEYSEIARKFALLAKEIEAGPLDLLAYEIFPRDVWEILGVPNFHELPAAEHSGVANAYLKCWPSIPELLREMAARADRQASDEMKKKRADARATKNMHVRVFVWHLGKEFRRAFGSAMLGTLARIADVTFDAESGEELSRSFVQSALMDV